MTLLQVYHVDLRQAAWFSAVPWTVMAVMGYIGGLWSDVMIRNGTSVTLTRKIMQVYDRITFNYRFIVVQL